MALGSSLSSATVQRCVATALLLGVSACDVKQASDVAAQHADGGVLEAELVWTHAQDSGGSDFARQVAVFGDDQVYLVGYSDGAFSDEAPQGAWDAFALKSDAAGNQQWARQWGTDSPEFAQSVAVDGAGNVFVAGYTYGGLAEPMSFGKYDAFLSKLDRDGNLLWLRQWGTPEHDYVYGLAVTLGGDAFVVGYTEGDLAAANAGEADAFIALFNAAGDSLSMTQWGTAATDYAQGVAADAQGDVWVTGYTQGELDGNGNIGSEDAFLTRFDAVGDKQWTTQWGSRMTDYGLSVVADDTGNAFVTGYTYGSVEAEAWQGGQDAFLSGFANDGSLLFSRQWGTRVDDNARALTLVGSLLLVTGDTQGAFTSHLAGGGRDSFLAVFDTQGRVQHTAQWGSAGNDFALGIAAASDGAVYVAGYREQGEGAGLLRDALLSKWLIE